MANTEDIVKKILGGGTSIPGDKVKKILGGGNLAGDKVNKIIGKTTSSKKKEVEIEDED